MSTPSTSRNKVGGCCDGWSKSVDGRPAAWPVASSALSESQCESTAFSSSNAVLASLPAVAASLMCTLAVGSSSLSEESERRRRWIGEVGVLRFVGRKVAMRLQISAGMLSVMDGL